MKVTVHWRDHVFRYIFFDIFPLGQTMTNRGWVGGGGGWWGGCGVGVVGGSGCGWVCTVKKKELYGTSKKGSADDKKVANMFKVSKKE
jgi:hypothetical protein